MSQPARRLSDKIILAHRQAVAERKAEVADLLIQALELDASYIGGPATEHRDDVGDIEAAFELHARFKDEHDIAL
ncbi:hypothetical protein [Thalassospira sp.]|uniref:hypothetical protein n=1 Tax=Thalassospira sp. TaxID=1912094 RepID=UPI002734A21E|nr:hypothetical protein [Thalassospira sp.]MDP2697040.1 hypothetical protein [Thalassospira sp.]